jgi:RimJ/RimL family protein N-acetyltransferase
MLIQPLTLEGRRVRLEPLTLAHHSALCEVGLDDELWRWTTALIRTPDEMRAYIETALEEQSKGLSLPFVMIDKSSVCVAGSTRFGNIDKNNRRLEIGWTWLRRDYQRTPINTEAKYLLLRHAFERLNAIRVELKTDSLNERSRRAILRIGAKEEGTFRNHMIVHTVYYSVIASEWENVKACLEEKLSRAY